jgi:hypothetical protein
MTAMTALRQSSRKAGGLSFDRIVSAIDVHSKERSIPMTVSPSVPTTIEMRRSRLVGLISAVALVTAVITWVVLTFAVDLGTESGRSSVEPTTPTVSISQSQQRFLKGIGSMAQAQQDAAVLYALGLSPKERQYVLGITSLTRTQQAAAFGQR